jgi:NAD(P)-dependent dehydrogenase (short-subunit alcohol dehydrogenase family)
MSGRLTGKVALVTGAGQGIGRGVALALAKESAAVAVVGRTPGPCEKVAAELVEVGAQALAVQCDVADRAQVERAVAQVVERFSGLDVLVNNAQSSRQQLIADIVDDDVEECWRSGALGTLYAMQAALPHLRARGGGAIINFGSSTAIDGNVSFGAYAMAKEAIRGLSRVAAREWGRYGIRVNVVVPNALSPAAERYADQHPERFEAMAAALPLRRVGDPELDIGRAVVALASDDLAYLTGDTLRLTGGG